MDPHTANNAMTYLVGFVVPFVGLFYCIALISRYKNHAWWIPYTFFTLSTVLLLFSSVMDWVIGK
jgi:predicted membrane channel-forming protein YqfA (hemolysin III family)